jgi:peptide/nickel transport system substrate-binding protein
VSTTRTTRTRWRTARYGTAAVAVLALGVVSACSNTATSSSSSTPSSSTSATGTPASNSGNTTFPRNETVFTSGTMYSPPSTWNPLNTGNYETGAQGLIYEPLNLYNPENSSSPYMPWLATNTPSTGWQGNKYVIDVRSGVKWSNGTPLTANDVAFSINLAAQNSADPYNENASGAKAVASGNTVTVTFSGTPGYTQFNDYLWKAPVLPQAIWSKIPASQIATYADTSPVGTGPMTLDTYNTTEAAYQTNPNWWGTSALGLTFKFKYLVDVVNGSNDQELGQVTAGNIDWSNNFLPGINSLMTTLNGGGGYTLKTYYPSSPYMLSGNTVWLEPNTTKAPMNNVDFRRALAAALDPQAIAATVYGGIATASNPVGLLPNLVSAGYLNSSVVSQYSVSNNPSEAKTLLKASGYNGQTITIQAPAGWTDWDDALTVIKTELENVGINVSILEPTSNARTANLTSGNYDLALDNNATLDSTPWSYFQRIYQLPIAAQQTAQLNWERYTSNSDWALVQEAGTTAPSDTSKLDGIYSTLEKDFLQQEPEIPLWYNGVWFQGNTTYWQNFPASGGSDQFIPSMWRGYLGAMTTVYALANLQPNPSAPKS